MTSSALYNRTPTSRRSETAGASARRGKKVRSSDLWETSVAPGLAGHRGGEFQLSWKCARDDGNDVLRSGPALRSRIHSLLGCG